MDIRKYLKDNELDCEVYEHENGCVSVEIEWGDWKHEHRYLDYIMNELGYSLYTEDVTESDGSDCYSALHYYKKIS